MQADESSAITTMENGSDVGEDFSSDNSIVLGQRHYEMSINTQQARAIMSSYRFN